MDNGEQAPDQLKDVEEILDQRVSESCAEYYLKGDTQPWSVGSLFTLI